jgi:uncharacterized protein YndB with AHSA1/START domain
MENYITVKVKVSCPQERAWCLWTDPRHIVRWNNASDDWHTPHAENDLRSGGKFLYRMEARDGSMGFDFTGRYTMVELYERIDYTMDDGRKVSILFEADGDETAVTEHFEPESENSVELQQAGWQAILNNFMNYADSFEKPVRMHFERVIDAPATKVYHIMLEDRSYREWTKVFNPTSHFKGTWGKGTKIHFIGTGENGESGGMVSLVEENITGQFVSLRHLGILKNGIEFYNCAEVESWAGLHENYTFSEVDGKTLLSIDTDAITGFESYFNETWPKALDILKALSESNSHS